MIRPATLLSIAAAFGSGLYLYAEKHQAGILDRQIAQVYRATQDVHERTGQLRTEWALLNDPSRLQDMAGKYLQLKTIEPARYVQFEQLGGRLPGPDGAAPVASAPSPAPPAHLAEAGEPAPDAPVPDPSVPGRAGSGAAFVDAPEPSSNRTAAARPASIPVVPAPSSPVKEAPRIAVARALVIPHAAEPHLSPPPAREPERFAARFEPKPRAPVIAKISSASFEMTMERIMRETHPAPVVTRHAAAPASSGYLPEFTEPRRPAPVPAPPPRTNTALAYAQPQPRFLPQPYYAAAPGYSYAPPGYYSRY